MTQPFKRLRAFCAFALFLGLLAIPLTAACMAIAEGGESFRLPKEYLGHRRAVGGGLMLGGAGVSIAAGICLYFIDPTRRWLQFRLRTLLGMIALAAIGLALIVLPAERQKRAVAFVLSLDGAVTYDDDTYLRRDDPRTGRALLRQWLGDDYFTSVVEIHLSDTQVTGAGLKHLKGFSRLQGLELSGTQVSDEGLEHLKGLHALKWISLNDTKVSDVVLSRIRLLTGLQVLWLNGAQVTKAGIADLQAALPDCQIIGPEPADWRGRFGGP